MGPALAARPLLLTPTGFESYALLDSGRGRKLERYGGRVVVRPEPQCLWRPAMAEARWAAADAVFEAQDDEDAGRWRSPAPLSQSWPMAFDGVGFLARLTAFRHLGVFPEHAATWGWLKARLAARPPGFRLLNLFGYTGIASLVAAAAGASVTHVDASKRAIGWARENARHAGLDAAPIRWLAEDATRWVERERRRGNRYDGILVDPPKFGRGPAGEVWRLLEDLPALVAGCAELLAEDADFLVLNAYAERLSGVALAALLGEALAGRGGEIEWGELALAEEGAGRAFGVSFFARWRAREHRS